MTTPAIQSLARSLGEWAAKPANEKFLRLDQEAQLQESLGDPSRRTQVQVAAWMLGTWHLGRGLVQVLQGEGRGFDEARQGQALRRCSLLLRDRHQPGARRGGAGKLPFSLRHGTLTALLGLALHDPGAEPLYELLRRLPDSAFGEDEHLALFTRELLLLHAGERPAVTPRLGPFQEVLMHWDGDGRVFAQRLAAVCDLHLQQVRGAGAWFDDPPCQLYPLEVLAVQAVREWCERPMPKVEHPLVFTNLGLMKPQGPWPQHPWVQRLERELGRR